MIIYLDKSKNETTGIDRTVTASTQMRRSRSLLAPSFAPIVVSDCLFRAPYDAALARALAALLAAAGPAAPEILVAFQLRDDADLLLFTHALPYFGLRGDRIDIDAHLAGLRWHNVPSHAIRDHLFLYGVVAAPR